MQASFSIHVDVANDLVRIGMNGFFEPQDIMAFRAQRDVSFQQLTCAPNQHLTLVDIRGMNIQSQETVALFTDLLTYPVTISRRIAFVVGTSLARSQILRAAAGRGRLFPDLAQAEEWRFQPEAAAA